MVSDGGGREDVLKATSRGSRRFVARCWRKPARSCVAHGFLASAEACACQAPNGAVCSCAQCGAPTSMCVRGSLNSRSETGGSSPQAIFLRTCGSNRDSGLSTTGCSSRLASSLTSSGTIGKRNRSPNGSSLQGCRALTVLTMPHSATTINAAMMTTNPASEIPHSDEAGGVSHSARLPRNAPVRRLNMKPHATAWY